jgi:TIR domain
MAFRVFLSHSYSDKAAVGAIHDQLATSGIEVWVSEQHPEPGSQVSSKILDAIRQTDVLVVLLTEASSVSQYVHQEIGAALIAKKPVIPLATFHVPDDRLGILAGVEWLQVDPSNPAAAGAELAAWLLKRRDLKVRQEALTAAILVGLILVLALASTSD